MRKDRLDGVGLGALGAVTALLAVNQIIVKEVNTGLQPVFFAGLRSALAVVFVWGWLWYRGLLGRVKVADFGVGLAIGSLFAIEFLCLFMALDLTDVSRASVIFYSMPVWMGILGHFFLPGERLNAVRGFGLLLAFLGTGWAILSRNTGAGAGSIIGDLWRLAARWAGLGLRFLRARPVCATQAPRRNCFGWC